MAETKKENIIWVPFSETHIRRVPVIDERKHSERGLISVGREFEPRTQQTNFWVVWRPNRTVKQRITVLEVYQSEEEAIRSVAYWVENHKTQAPPKRRVRDAQRSKVYAWEREMAMRIGPEEFDRDSFDIYSGLLRKRSREELNELLTTLSRAFGIRKPRLVLRRSGTTSRAQLTKNQIRLIPKHCNRLVVIHEFAHILQRRWFGFGRVQSHGREFVGVYGYLLIRFGGVNEREFLDSCKEKGIHCDLPSQYFEWRDARQAA